MEKILIALVDQLNLPQLVAILGMFWFFYNRLDRKFDKIDKRFEQVDKRFDRLEEKITDIDRRICRIEGALATKDCCMLKDDRQDRKVD